MTPPTESFDRSRPLARRLEVRRAGRRGFTLIEMMVTISILLLLMGIVTAGLYSVIGGNQRRQTEAILKRAQAFTAEISNTKQARDSFYQRVMWTTYGVATPSATSTAGSTAASSASATEAVKISSFLLTFKPNRDAASKLPPRNLGDMPAAARAAFTGTDGQLLANALMDTWGNPILFVPDGYEYLNPTSNISQPVAAAGGLTGIYSTVSNSYWGASAPAGSPSGAAKADDRFRAPDRRPFWFSAGPDGNYATHDDNVYSFN